MKVVASLYLKTVQTRAIDTALAYKFMEIKKTDQEITSMVKTTMTYFTLTNDKGEELDVSIEDYYCDRDGSYDQEETIWNESEKKEIKDWEEWCINFFGEDIDPDNVIDEMRDLINKK